MRLPKSLAPYTISGLSLRMLTPADVPQMLDLQTLVMDALPDKRWYFPSDENEFIGVVNAQEAVGYFDGEALMGFAELTPGLNRGAHSYAAILGDAAEHSFDFHDVMVHPAMRGQGMHTRFLALFEQVAKEDGARAIYATVDPDNAPSWHNFEKAGYELITVRPAYDGRMRRYYRLMVMRNI